MSELPHIRTLASQLCDTTGPAQRRALAKGITLIESSNSDHQEQAQRLLNLLLPATGNALRIGISGTPGVGKSTFIEAFGLYLIALGKRVAVLAVDPSSPLRGGSILGDKTRMERLARDDRAFIRPSPSSGALGGVAQKTRESMLLCEAAGYDVVLVETVGVGQSEYEVASMVDFFLVLMQPNAGDELQGIKRGIMELADGLIINKADGDSLNQAKQTQRHCQNALHLLHSGNAWEPQALTCSALNNEGMDDIWSMLQGFVDQATQSGDFATKRATQNQDWMNQLIQYHLRALFERNSNVRSELDRKQLEVRQGRITPFAAAQQLISIFQNN